MEKEYHVRHADGDFALLMTSRGGITIRTPARGRAEAKSLFKNARGGMDVCVSCGGVVYVMAQTQSGAIIKIIKRDGVWHRFDVLVPKNALYYPKRFALCPQSDGVFAFFSLRGSQNTSLCMTNLSKSGAVPAMIAHIGAWDAFDAAKSPGGVCAAFTDEAGTLYALFYEPLKNKKSLVPLLSGGGFSNIRAFADAGALHTVFLRDGRLFYIETDARTRLVRAIHDLGAADADAELSLSHKRGALFIHTVSESAADTLEFDLKRRVYKKTTRATGSHAPCEIKHVFAGGSETELVI
ncbi:MAG: hypothetical protein IKD89_01795 [Clostridia bacterium]|nr:hypothetical protein [Clostridia bacterium]